MIALLLAGCQAEPVDDFIMGVNYPWHHYGLDFGESAWGDYGIDSDRDRVSDDLEELSSAGVEAVRWFLFADGRASPMLGEDDMPVGLSEAFYADLDASLVLAEAADIQILFVLFDYCWLLPAEMVDGVQLFGRSVVMTDPARRAALEGEVLRPLLQHVGDHPAILGWEVMNEPEWVLGDALALDPAIDDFIAVIREESSLPVTLGAASRETLGRWSGRGLDWLQVHDYDDPTTLPAASELASEPVLLGEFATAWEDEASVLDVAWRGDYIGAWGWSYRGDDAASALDLDALRDWRPPRE
jgi:hypothetical protein